MPINALQISDTHLTATGDHVHQRDPDRRLRAVLDAVMLHVTHLDVVLVTGDLTDDGSVAACARLAEALSRFAVPVLAVPGNHDDPQVVRKVFERDAIDVGRWRIIGVDTSRPQQTHGAFDATVEVGRLDGYDHRPTVLAMHHPPVSPSDKACFRLDGAPRLIDAVTARPHVKAIVTGHLHDAFSLAIGNTPVWGCPSTLISFRHLDENTLVGGATGARMLTLRDDGTITTALLRA